MEIINRLGKFLAGMTLILTLWAFAIGGTFIGALGIFRDLGDWSDWTLFVPAIITLAVLSARARAAG